MYLTIRQAKGRSMLVYLYTYFLNGTQLNVRVHECDCGGEPQYHPTARFNAPLIVGRVVQNIRKIRMIYGVSYASYDEQELFIIIQSGTRWGDIEHDVLDIMADVERLETQMLIGRLATVDAQRRDMSDRDRLISEITSPGRKQSSQELYDTPRLIQDVIPFDKPASEIPPYRVNPKDYRHPYDHPAG